MKRAASVGVVVLTCLFAGTIVHSAPPPLQEDRERAEHAAEEAALRKAFKDSDVPIVFWGRVVDQKGDGIDGANVIVGVTRYDPHNPMFLGVKSIDVLTDKAGHFAVENERGSSLSVRQIAKDGYVFPSDELARRGPFYYVPSYTDRHIPDPDNPVVFRMRKIGETALLLSTVRSQSIRVRPDGQVVVGSVPSPEFRSYHPDAADLLPGFAVSGKVSDVNRDWVFNFTGKREGDKVLLLDRMPYRAPEEGYASSAEFRVPLRNGPSPEPYPRGVETFLVVRTTAPEVFLAVRLHVNPSEDICIIYYNMTINPYGGRSFEPADLGKYWRLAKTLRREVVQALCAGRLPPEPNIPALIRSAERLSQDAADTLAELQGRAARVAQTAYWAVPKDRLDVMADDHRGFREKLQVLNTQVDDDTAREIADDPDAGVQRNLIAIACDYVRNPELYDRVVEQFGLHLQTAPTLPRELLRNEYRLPWELLLLSPSSGRVAYARPLLFQAIGTIQNDDSIPILLWLYELVHTTIMTEPSYVPFRDENAAAEQVHAVQTLGRYRSPAALRAMLRCVAMAEAVKRTVPQKDGRSIKEWAVHVLRDQDAENGKPWREVIDDVLREKNALSDADRAFLQDMLKAPGGRRAGGNG